LAPNEREAVFETLDEEVAAEALEELEPKFQKAVVESLETDRAADIVEEMEPDAAADLLGDLSEDRTEEILVQMQPEERREVADLLEFGENTAAGRMTTEYIALPVTATAHDAIEAMRNFGGRMESMSTIFLIDSNGTLAGTVPVVKIAMAKSETPLLALHQEPLIYSRANAKEKEYAELFDKYNLLTLPVVDDHNRLVGVITPDDVINMLRAKL
jgi:magnesium transporter